MQHNMRWIRDWSINLATSDDVIDTIADFAGKDGHDFAALRWTGLLHNLCPPRYSCQIKPQIGFIGSSGTIIDDSSSTRHYQW